MDDLAAIERELFAVTFSADAGKLVLVQPRYWDLQGQIAKLWKPLIPRLGQRGSV